MPTSSKWMLLFAAFLITQSAWARVYDMYRPDYPKGAFCSAIAGACAADDDLENSFFQNPASLTGEWNFDGDYNNAANLEPGVNQKSDAQESQYMGGIGSTFGRWGLGFAVVGKKDVVNSQVAVTDEQGFRQNFALRTQTSDYEFRLPVSYRISKRLIVGVAPSVNSRTTTLTGANGAKADYGTSQGFRLGLTFGFQYQAYPKIRVGSWFRMPRTSYASLNFSTQVYSTNLAYQEDLAFHDPWIWVWGVALNPWMDPRTFFIDLNFIGPTHQGLLLGYDTFSTAAGDARLKAKGRFVAIEPRLGYRTPWWKGSKGTAMMGLYYEEARTETVNSRIHATAGASYQVLSWIELMAGVDVARDFTQIFLTFR